MSWHTCSSCRVANLLAQYVRAAAKFSDGYPIFGSKMMSLTFHWLLPLFGVFGFVAVRFCLFVVCFCWFLLFGFWLVVFVWTISGPTRDIMVTSLSLSAQEAITSVPASLGCISTTSKNLYNDLAEAIDVLAKKNTPFLGPNMDSFF